MATFLLLYVCVILANIISYFRKDSKIRIPQQISSLELPVVCQGDHMDPMPWNCTYSQSPAVIFKQRASWLVWGISHSNLCLRFVDIARWSSGSKVIKEASRGSLTYFSLGTWITNLAWKAIHPFILKSSNSTKAHPRGMRVSEELPTVLATLPGGLTSLRILCVIALATHVLHFPWTWRKKKD